MSDSKEKLRNECTPCYENRLWDYVKSHMLQYPEQIICDDKISETFCQMVEKAEDFAKNLTGQKYGIDCGSDVLTIKALLACLAAGAAAVPLSNRYGSGHRERIIEAAQISSLISDEGGQLHITGGGSGRIEKELEGTAWILFTSGSSGEPKGVMLSEKAVYHNLKASEMFYDTDSRDILLANRGFYHCSSLTGELMMSLIRGVKICCRSIGFSPYLILSQMEADSVSLYSGTPTVFYQLCRALKREKTPDTALKYCNVGGEALNDCYRDMLINTLQETKLVHSYGMTETCSRATYHFLHGSDKKASCAGKMLSCLKAVIADEKGNELPEGQKGEIRIKGACIMDGYYRNPDLTDSVLQDGWLRTGDIGFKDGDGLLYICGRRDSMLIRGGVNVYPEEIEYLLKKHPDVENAKITVQYKDAGNPQLHARVWLAEPYRTDYKKLAEICKNIFSGYQMPDTVELADCVRLSQAGKII